MAQLAANPWKVTSADVLPLIISKGMVKIRHIEFSGYAAGTGIAVINDTNGNLITQLQSAGGTDAEEKRTGNIGYVTGVTVQSISSGQVLIYFE